MYASVFIIFDANTKKKAFNFKIRHEWENFVQAQHFLGDKLISAVKVVDAKKWKSTFAKTARTQSASTDTFFSILDFAKLHLLYFYPIFLPDG